MGQSSLILVLMATLTVGILLYNSQIVTTRSDTVLSVKQEEALARETAIVGLNRVIRTLVDRPDEWAQTATFAVPETTYDGYGSSAAYRVDVHNYRPGSVGTPGLPTIDDTLDVRSTGTFRDRDYTIRATYTKGYTNVGVPPALRRAIVSDQTLDFNGNPKIRSASSTTNADVHANATLDANGSPVNFVIEGYGTYTGTYDGSNTAFFQPNQTDPSAGGATYQHEALYVPTVDVTAAAATAHAITNPPTGTFTASGNLWDNLTDGLDPTLAPSSVMGKGTSTDPFIWYVGGNMVVEGSGGLRFPRATGPSAPQGHLKLYVDGNLTFTGSGTMTPTYSDAPANDNKTTDADIRNWIAANLPEGMSMAIYVAENVNFNGNVSVAALIHANGAVKFNGGGNRVNLIGGVVSRHDMTFNGNNKLWYTEASETVKDPGYDYDVPTGVFLLDYLEWPDQPSTP
jgi:hypothetical protein